DIAQDGDAPFIVAEYVKGYDVRDLLTRRSTLNAQFARRISEQLLGALAYAHQRGIIHRDIKPSNILMNTNGVVKVADFGIARIVEDDAADAGEPGEIVGSARYMSPEQLRGAEAKAQSDIYSVGVLLYHCLTGEPPFSGDIKSLARQHLKSTPRSPRKINRKISPAMEAVILKCLAKDPEDRYSSADAVLNDLESDAPRKVAVRTAETPIKSTATGRRGYSKRLLLATGVVATLLGGSAALASGLGYVNLPGGDGLQALTKPATPKDSKPVAAPQKEPEADVKVAEDAQKATPESPEPETPAPEPKSENVSSRSPEARVTEEPPQPAQMVPVPNVLEYYDYSVIEILNNRGFKANIVRGSREGYADTGVAWGTEPAIGTLMPAGSTITVYVTPELYNQPRIRS
ncbi:MAG: protein kinase domain-containing protein, partial [Rubrobacteraceae bacterium]